MERSLSFLTFKGSIPEAIGEAKKQKKLFVVYISGEDEHSVNLENTTWTDLKVADSLSKYCILLHIPEGSTDATNFCAIYPQTSVPSITAIGYNGLQVWKSEGFVSAEVLASSLEKAWLSLHIQETTATVLTAALASKKSETPPPGTSVGTSEQGSSSGTAVPSPSLHKNVQSSEDASSVRSEMVKENKTEMDVKTSSEFVNGSQSRSIEDLNSSSEPGTVMADPGSPEAEHTSFSVADSSASVPLPVAVPAVERNIDIPSGVAKSHAKTISAEANEALHYEKADAKDDEKVNSLGDNTVSESSDVHLNIRLPNGISLQEKFAGTSILRTVKDYVDRNGASGLGSYDLAVPYPRKLFSNEDLSKSLFELSLFNRQALIVVPRQRASGHHGGGSSSLDKTSSTRNADSSNQSEGGYFSYVRSILSYVNPFAYFRSGVNSSSPGQDSQAGVWEYSPNPALGNNLARRETNDNSSSGRNDGRIQRPTTSRIGSNIHTLKRDEDDNRFSDRNAFWNGNSTQYGGDNNGR